MPHSFQIYGLAHEQFESLFLLSDEQLNMQGVTRCIATEHPGFPCRITLEDASVGEELLLLSYLHQPAASPYRASGPIFVRRGAKPHRLGVGEVPNYVSSRLMSVRAYDVAHMMVGASVCEGEQTTYELGKYFNNELVEYIHLHNARQGCFSCQVIRG